MNFFEFDIEKKAQTFKRAVINIDLDAITQNMINMKKNISEDTQIIAVIKTNGYGHGAYMIAKNLEDLDFVFGYAVATAEEAAILRTKGIKKPILILSYTFSYSYEYLVREDIRPSVFRYDTVDELSKIALALNKKVKVHIKVDTGMHRIGVSPDEEGLKFVEYVSKKPGLEIEGIFTHFARADEYDKTNVNKQLKIFKDFVSRIQNELKIDIPYKHCSNSAAILEIKEGNMNLVRAGITMYGLYPSDEVSKDIVSLTPALSLLSSVVYIKTIHKADAVSYGGIYVADSDRLIATVSIGYGDGYPRSLSNKGYVLIKGQRAPIVGRICMDQLMVDITDLKDVSLGDQVTLIGKNGDEMISAEMLGDMSGRFNYELVCDLNERLPRVYYKDKKIVDISSEI